MKDGLDKDETIDNGNSSDSFLKIEPTKKIDISNIKIETIEPEKEDIVQNNKNIKDNSKIIKIIIAILVLILCLGGGYFAYSKIIDNNGSKELTTNTVIEEVVQETPQKEPNSLAALGEPIVENSQEIETEEEPKSESIGEEPIVEEQEIIQEENNNQIDDYDLMVLERVYDEVINKGNEGYLYNFSSDELAIIRNTLYARRGYKFKKKKYQNYFGAKSWYNPTTNSQNILTKKEEKLANIIKRYE